MAPKVSLPRRSDARRRPLRVSSPACRIRHGPRDRHAHDHPLPELFHVRLRRRQGVPRLRRADRQAEDPPPRLLGPDRPHRVCLRGRAEASTCSKRGRAGSGARSRPPSASQAVLGFLRAWLVGDDAESRPSLATTDDVCKDEIVKIRALYPTVLPATVVVSIKIERGPGSSATSSGTRARSPTSRYYSESEAKSRRSASCEPAKSASRATSADSRRGGGSCVDDAPGRSRRGVRGRAPEGRPVVTRVYGGSASTTAQGWHARSAV